MDESIIWEGTKTAYDAIKQVLLKFSKSDNDRITFEISKVVDSKID